MCATHLFFFLLPAVLNWFPLCSCPQVQYMAYVGIGGRFSMLKTLFAGVVFWFLVKFSLGRGLLTQVQYHLKSHWITVELLQEYLMDKIIIHTHSYHRTSRTAYINSWIFKLKYVCVCFFISFQYFSHLVCSPRLDQQESRYKKWTEMSKTQYQMLTSVIHSPRLCCWS